MRGREVFEGGGVGMADNQGSSPEYYCDRGGNILSTYFDQSGEGQSIVHAVSLPLPTSLNPAKNTRNDALHLPSVSYELALPPSQATTHRAASSTATQKKVSSSVQHVTDVNGNLWPRILAIEQQLSTLSVELRRSLNYMRIVDIYEQSARSTPGEQQAAPSLPLTRAAFLSDQIDEYHMQPLEELEKELDSLLFLFYSHESLADRQTSVSTPLLRSVMRTANSEIHQIRAINRMLHVFQGSLDHVDKLVHDMGDLPTDMVEVSSAVIATGEDLNNLSHNIEVVEQCLAASSAVFTEAIDVCTAVNAQYRLYSQEHA